MAETSVTDPAAAQGNGAAPEQIEVENPATGAIAGTVPRMSVEDVGPDGGARPRRAARLGGAWASRAARGSCAAPRSGCSTTPTA